MKVWQEWNDWRRFQKLPARERTIVFYSEPDQDWHHLRPLIDFLTELHTFRIGSGVLRTWFFQMLKADVMVLTMLNLHNFQLKRSLHPVHYVYVFHSMGSTHMVDHENSTGPHHVAEIRRREKIKGLPPKHLFACGHPRLELPGAGLRVILRPHYQTARLAPRLVERLVAKFGKHPQLRHVDRMEESASLLESDVLISDWSAMAIEYALGFVKPVLFVDVPPRVRNPKYSELGLEPMEMRIRRELGTVLPLEPAGARPPGCRGATSKRSGVSRAVRGPAGRGDIQLRPVRRTGSEGDRPHRRRAGGRRLAQHSFVMGPPRSTR